MKAHEARVALAALLAGLKLGPADSGTFHAKHTGETLAERTARRQLQAKRAQQANRRRHSRARR